MQLFWKLTGGWEVSNTLYEDFVSAMTCHAFQDQYGYAHSIHCIAYSSTIVTMKEMDMSHIIYLIVQIDLDMLI